MENVVEHQNGCVYGAKNITFSHSAFTATFDLAIWISKNIELKIHELCFRTGVFLASLGAPQYGTLMSNDNFGPNVKSGHPAIFQRQGRYTIILFTLTQIRAAKAMFGRIMSLVMLSSIGLRPVSQTISGAICTWSVGCLRSSAGALIVLASLWTLFN